jgi:endoglucanase
LLAADYEFAGWSGGLSGTSNPVSILMCANKTVTANFVPEGSVAGCINPETISIPFSKDGAGDYCRFTSTTISYINNWNMAELTINEVNFTNAWSNNLPDAVNGGWTIHYIRNIC